MMTFNKYDIESELPEALETKGKSLDRFRPHYIGFFVNHENNYTVDGEILKLRFGAALGLLMQGADVKISDNINVNHPLRSVITIKDDTAKPAVVAPVKEVEEKVIEKAIDEVKVVEKATDPVVTKTPADILKEMNDKKSAK
jgi:hypothetical protein